MDTNDLPVTQKLAALMEAGRACNPNMQHARGTWGDGKRSGCAMTFAFAGAGISMKGQPEKALASILGITQQEMDSIRRSVVSMNDRTKASLDEIIAAVREDRLDDPGVKHIYYYGTSITMKTFEWVSVDECTGSLTVKAFKSPKVKPEPAKKVRKSAKTGATWPVARGCYA
jgi:hypothetical protein